jgi:hypothetical protein
MGVSNTDMKISVSPQVLSLNEFRGRKSLSDQPVPKIVLDSNNDIRKINKVIKGGW